MKLSKLILSTFILSEIVVCYSQNLINDTSCVIDTTSGFFFGIHDDIQVIIGKLNNPKINFNDENKMYTMTWDNGLEIETPNKHYISMIKIYSSEYKTQKGISINDSFGKVLQLYGTPIFKYATIISYYLDIQNGTIIVFKITNNKVKEILIGYSS